MVQSLYDHLYHCVVNISAGDAQGTGFFVVPGCILTCAHVVVDASSITVAWNGSKYAAQVIETRDVDFPDIALLKVDIPNHPCVLLAGGAEPFNRLYTY